MRGLEKLRRRANELTKRAQRLDSEREELKEESKSLEEELCRLRVALDGSPDHEDSKPQLVQDIKTLRQRTDGVNTG